MEIQRLVYVVLHFKCPSFIRNLCNECKPNSFCPLPKCAKSRNVETCFDYKEFPCKLNYERGPIAKEVLDYIKGI